MLKVSIKNIKSQQITNVAQFETQELAQEWIDRHSNMGSFGKLERLIPQSECSPEELAEALELLPEVIGEDGFVSPALARLPQTFEVIIEDITAQAEQEKINEEALKFLANSDWKVIRHRDQQDLGIATSLTGEEFQDLLQERQMARNAILR